MRKLILFSILILLLVAPIAVINAQDSLGASVTCSNGFTIENGVEVIVNIRSGFTYTATAVGIDGFDPVMAVVVRDQVQGCSDDADNAASYSVNLPTTGPVRNSSLSAQLPFSNPFSGFEDVSIIVANLNGGSGEYVLIIEGLSVTAADGSGAIAGDPFGVIFTENMRSADADLSVYMIGVDSGLDPYLSLVNTNTEEQIAACDDAGSSTCGGTSLNNYTISRSSNREAVGDNLDSSLTIQTTQLTDLDLPILLPFRMTSFAQRTTGEYIVAFHVGIGGEDEEEGRSGGGTTSTDPTPAPDGGDVGFVDPETGVNVSCPNGLEIIGGVEIIVNVRAGFTYTATAIGVNRFDPVMAVIVQDRIQDCADDSDGADNYTANLPSTGGIVNSSTLNAQLPYNNPFGGFEDVSIIVGGFAGQTGEFVLILEGMAVTSADGSGTMAGDPFGVSVTPNMVSSGLDMWVYMIGVDNTLDPYMSVVNYDTEEQIFICDDAGGANCEGGVSLIGSSVSRTQGRTADADNLDSMLGIPTTSLTDLEPGDSFFIPLLMSSFNQRTAGEYLVAFHIGIGTGDINGGNSGGSDL